MRKQKKVIISLIIFCIVILLGIQVFATDLASYLGEMEFSESYLQYLELSDEEKNNVIIPRMYEIPKNKMMVKNPLKLVRMLGSSVNSKYSLRDVIPENMVIKNQQNTNSCWTFSSLASLESNLALKDYKNGISTKIYDFSERHMEYATSKTFLNNEINKWGFNREIGKGGNFYLSIPYLTNGTGAIAESEMPFENNENKIDISKIQNKDVITQVNDVVIFPAYSTSEDKTEIIKQIKQHIQNYGGIDTCIYGSNLFDTSCYNNETGAIYCNSSIQYPANHAVTIIGWDDDYSVENFAQSNKPTNNGAWVIKNSWGTEIENNGTATNVGDNGFMYVSYEDANIYLQMSGIMDAQSEIEYENIYQYDEYGGYYPIKFTTSKIYLATVFDKKTTKSEYLTQVSINASETYTCKVYVNPNGKSKAMSDLQQIELETGEFETFDAGYHTIKFLNPIKINSDSFVVVLEIQGTQENSMSAMMEFNFGEFYSNVDHGFRIFDNVTVESKKCFWTTEKNAIANRWYDASKTYTENNGKWPNFDTTIKAFTKVINILENIEVITPPSKTSYIEGQDFDATGMIVKANYDNEKSEHINDYVILNGTSLALGQNSVTISYNDKTTTQSIEVVKNTVESIKVQNRPTKIEYWPGENFDVTGMVIEATYKDGTTKQVNDYAIQDGVNLKNGQTSITIEYEGKTITQAITVKLNTVEKIEIKKSPNKLKYVAGQNFDKTGMIIEAIYADGTVKQIEDYVIQDGINLQPEQRTITIIYEEKTVLQVISVEIKDVTSISVKTIPTKTVYIQYREQLDLEGGIIEIIYNDDSKEEMLMKSEEIIVSGFNNQQIGINTITLTYKDKIVEFDVEVIEVEKPVSSNFDNIKGKVKEIKAYYFTDINKKEYSIINLELNNLLISNENDKIEYYYYLSSNKGKNNIVDWIKVKELERTENKLAFEINTKDISNYEEVANSNILYLYLKEVATRNNIATESITSSVLLEVENIEIEEYIDGKKKANINSGTILDSAPAEKKDTTVAQGVIPNAGKNILIICSILGIIIVGVIVFLRYKDIEIK